MRQALIVFFGGGMGAVLRFLLSGWIPLWAGTRFPWGILLINVLGCLAIGLLSAIGEYRVNLDPELRIFLTIGLLGGFTTFSTFSYETLALLRDGDLLLAGLYVAGSVGLGLGATALGFIVGKAF